MDEMTDRLVDRAGNGFACQGTGLLDLVMGSTNGTAARPVVFPVELPSRRWLLQATREGERSKE